MGIRRRAGLSGILLLVAAAVAAGCSQDGSGGGGGQASPGSSAGSGTPPPAPTPRIVVGPRALRIAGQDTFLYGGEMQYFRVRDPQWDVARTHALWAQGLDRMQAAGMNFITTYIPWDFHEVQPGVFDFSGVRDLGHFLDLCYQRGLHVQVKPGPLINSEWPRGLGTFGAVPAWWKDQNPGSLVLNADGNPWSFSPLGYWLVPDQAQPSYLDPTYLAAVERWFSALAPILRTYLTTKPCIVALQIDNETNLYFADHGVVDYNPAAVGFWRTFLGGRYPSIADLNAAYGTTYPDFASVIPPRDGPTTPANDPAWRDWTEAGQAAIGEYHGRLRDMWERLGFREPDLLFTTNDSLNRFMGSRHLLWNGEVKNQAGLAWLDAYPKNVPWNLEIMDLPFYGGWTAKYVDYWNDAYTGPSRAVFAAEIQGGIPNLPFGLPWPSTDATTDQLMCQLLGHGLTGAAVYVVHGGLNIDGSSYDFYAALAPDGTPHPKYDILRRYGQNIIVLHGDRLIASEEVEAPVAIAANLDLLAPQAAASEDPLELAIRGNLALFGWLLTAGYDPQVIDLRGKSAQDLAPYRAVFYLNPGYLSEATAQALDGYVRAGGVLVNVYDEGERDLFQRPGGAAHQQLVTDLFPATPAGDWTWTILTGWTGDVELAIPGQPSQVVRSYRRIRMWDVPAGATPFLYERTFLLGWRGRPIGYQVARGSGEVFFLGTDLLGAFASDAFFRLSDAEVQPLRALADWILGAAGVQPAVTSDGLRDQVIVRRIPQAAGGGAFLFVVHAGPAATLHVAVRDLAALGLQASSTYAVDDVLNQAALGSATGADLAANGLSLPVGSNGTAVVWIR